MNELEWSWQGGMPALGAALLLVISVFAVVASHRRLGHRSNRRWLGVALLNLLTAVALAALLNPPAWRVAADRSTTLLTAGALDELSGAETYFTRELDLKADRASLLLHAGQLPLRQTAIGLLDIRGHGLDPAELKAFPRDLAVEFSPPVLEGIIEPAWPRNPTVGTELKFAGRFVSPDEGPVDIELIDPAGRVQVRERRVPGERFELAFRPRSAGLVEYRIVASRNGRLLADERVPLDVGPGRPVEIRVLQSAPSFDTRQLRRWAGDRGSEVHIRTRVSADHWIAQGMNVTPGNPDSAIDLDRLSVTDLLILDGRAWAELAAGQRQLIAEAVEQGLGLMILADGATSSLDNVPADPLLAGFDLGQDLSGRTSGNPVLPGFSNDLEFPLSDLDIDPAGSQPLLRDASGLLLEAWRDHGAGRVAVSRMKERFRWVTSEQEALYSAYWNHVLRTVARPRQAPYLLPQEETTLLRPGKRARVCALSAGQPLRIGIAEPDGKKRVLEAEPSGLGGPDECVFFWPSRAGWHTVQLFTGSDTVPADRHRLFVTSPQDWTTASWSIRQAKTSAWFSPAAPSDGRDTLPRQVQQPLHPALPWIVFLLSSTLLWIERRMDAEA